MNAPFSELTSTISTSSSLTFFASAEHNAAAAAAMVKSVDDDFIAKLNRRGSMLQLLSIY